MPSKRWGELEAEAHGTQFAVAGATSKALLDDFRVALNKALVDGTTLTDFRKDFDSIVQRHGWSYNGSPGWRSAIIYETNLASAYAAGRYREMTTPEALDLFPYWRYRHHTCQHPRPDHVAWDGNIMVFWRRKPGRQACLRHRLHSQTRSSEPRTLRVICRPTKSLRLAISCPVA